MNIKAIIIKVFVISIVISIIAMIVFASIKFYDVEDLGNETNMTKTDNATTLITRDRDVEDSKLTTYIIVGIVSTIIIAVVVYLIKIYKPKNGYNVDILERLDGDDAEYALQIWLAKKLKLPILGSKHAEYVKDSDLEFTGEKMEWDNPNGSNMAAFEFECHSGNHAGTLYVVKACMNRTSEKLMRGNSVTSYKADIKHYRKFIHSPRKFPDYSHSGDKLRAIQVMAQLDPELLQSRAMDPFTDMFRDEAPTGKKSKKGETDFEEEN